MWHGKRAEVRVGQPGREMATPLWGVSFPSTEGGAFSPVFTLSYTSSSRAWLSVTAFHLAAAHPTLLTALTTQPTVPASSTWALLSHPSSRESPFLL